MQVKWFNILFLAGLASQSWALIVTPARTEIHLVPGASTQAELNVTNDDKEELQVDVSKKDWFVPTVNKKWTVDKWLDVKGPDRFYLKPGESRKVSLTIRCPKELDGEVVAMTSFVYQTDHPSMVTPMISVSMYLIASGTEKVGGKVEDLLVRMYKGEPNITAKVKCTGNIHLRPSGRLVVVDARGAELGQIHIQEGQPTYPGAESLYYGSVPDGVKFPAGVYTARADLSYGDLKLQGSRDFTVLPDGQIQMNPIK